MRKKRCSDAYLYGTIVMAAFVVLGVIGVIVLIADTIPTWGVIFLSVYGFVGTLMLAGHWLPEEEKEDE